MGVGPMQYPPAPDGPGKDEREPDAAKKRREARDKGLISEEDAENEVERIRGDEEPA